MEKYSFSPDLFFSIPLADFIADRTLTFPLFIYIKGTNHIILRYFIGAEVSQSEIAKTLNQPLGTIKTRMRQGMIRLHELIRENGTEF